MKNCRLFISILLVSLLMAVFPVSLAAQDFYWENPVRITPETGANSTVLQAGGEFFYFWQERDSNPDGIYLSLAKSRDGEEWEVKSRFLGPFEFVGSEIQYYSAVEGPRGVLYLAVSQPDLRIHIYTSRDGGETFTSQAVTGVLPTRVMPRLAVTARGGFLLFATQASGDSVATSPGISYSRSSDGTVWSDFEPFTSGNLFRGTFLPTHTVLNGRDYVAFQGYTQGADGVSTFQLYLRHSDNGGATWSEPRLLSNFSAGGLGASFYTNQRPYLTAANGNLLVAWERSSSGVPPQVYLAALDGDGNLLSQPEQISQGSWTVSRPKVFSLNSRLYVLWFDNRAGSHHVILARQDGVIWRQSDVTYAMGGNSTFPSFLISGGQLFLFWENSTGGASGRSSMVSLVPDRTVTPPVLRAANFAENLPVNQDSFSVRWNSPADSSGIDGYSYVLSRNPRDIPPQRVMVLDRNRVAEFTVKEDGTWYVIISALDYAGNWSEPAVISFIRDTTPPQAVVFHQPETDDAGMLLRNTGTITWDPPGGDPYIAGYSWRFQFLGDSAGQDEVDPASLLRPGRQIQERSPSVSFSNQDNGYWALTVCAIDTAGNVGTPASIFLRMNKYIPVTYVSRVDVTLDELGSYNLGITGRGFSAGGRVGRVIIDRDRQAPYDLDISGAAGLFTVENDRYISGPVLEDISTGTYWVGVEHPVRGIHFFDRTIELTSQGTIKFGDFFAGKKAPWNTTEKARWSFTFSTVLLAALFCFLALMLVFTFRKLALVVGESRALEREAKLLISGKEFLDEAEMQKMKEIKTKNRGLRTKFALLVTILVLIIVSMVAIPLAFITSSQQETILARGLSQRSDVLLESITSGARTYLPTQNLLELSSLPSQMTAMGEDALSVTITARGLPSGPDYDPDSFDFVWATNDPEILWGGRITAGTYRLGDEISPLIADLAGELEELAVSRVSDISREIARLNAQTAPLIAEFIRTNNPETEEALNAIQEQLRALDETLNQRLYEIGSRVYSYPPFDPQQLEGREMEYIFYKPILYRSNEDENFFRGIVRLGVSNENILQEINATRTQIWTIIALIGVAAIVLGILGSLLLAAIIIRPINILVRGVEQIRDAPKKQDLEDRPINTRTKDELATLAVTINEMTAGLIEAEKANDMLLGGKEVQKQFLPLELMPDGKNKATTGFMDTGKAEIFGYFEGALAVSGDYFDFRQIDDKHLAFIKCDVSGKGVPASLIAVQVATLYIRFFRNWQDRNNELLSQGKKGLALPDISSLVDQVNDNLDYVGIARQGKFAALIVGILNQETGECLLCHAGDSIIHIYDHKKGMLTEELERLPAAGSFSSEMIQMRGGFPVAKRKLLPGDALLLYTDGIEEAQRHFRNAEFQIAPCQEPGIEDGGDHMGHKKGDNYEEFGTQRIDEILNQLMKGGSFRLVKYHNPIPNEELLFDFSAAKPTIQNMIIALAAIERVFRIFPDPSAGRRDVVRIDRNIDTFLQEHFLQYKLYFGHPVDNPGVSEEDAQLYRYFSHLREDHQFDDLTLLAVQKK